MRGLDYLMRRKGRFLVLLAVFAVGSFLGYQAIMAWGQAQTGSDTAVGTTTDMADKIEVPHTGGEYQKHPEDGMVSDYSGGRTTVSDTLAQVGTFPFDFERDLKPGMGEATVTAVDVSMGAREVIRTVAKVVFGSSVLALALHFLSDRYLR